MANIEDLRDRSVSSGTLKSEDLIPKFLGVLKTYGKDKYDAYIKENPEVEDWENLDDETMGWVVDELADLLNEIAPDGCYFGASEGDGADFGFWSMSNESKKSEADGNKDIFTLDLTRIDADGDEEGLDDMQAAQTFYDEDDAIKAAKELADSYKDDDGVVQVIVMAGEQEKPNGDIVGDSFDIYWASSSDKQTTADYRKKARYAAFDNKMDYYAKGGKSEAKKSEGNDDDKGCKGKDCKDDKTKKNEADATFKVGDFVTYDATSDGKEDFINQYVVAEIAEINDDGSLVLWIYDLDDGGNDVKDADPQCCTKLDHFAGMVDANHYYMDGPYKAYKGGWEILITKKDLNPRVYEFIGTMDDLSEVLDIDDFYGGENFVFDEDLKDEVANNTGWDVETTTFADMTGDVGESKQTEGLPPKRLGSKRQYRSRADLINKMKQLGAVEITTSKQFNDIKNSQWLHTAGYALDTNGNLVAQSYYGDKDGKWYYTSTRNFDSDYLPESKQHENRTKEEEVTNIFKGMKEWADRWSYSDKDRKTIADNLDLEAVQENMSDIVEILDNNFEWDGYGFKFVVVGDYEDDDTRDEAEANQWNRCYGVCEEIADLIGIPNEGHAIGEMNIYFWEEIEADWRDDDSKSAESKKSESLTLKQKELKDMARFGQAEDITTISDEEAKALRKKGIETIGVSRGTYGMNGALLRDNEGKKYVITARSSNLFYFV